MEQAVRIIEQSLSDQLGDKDLFVLLNLLRPDLVFDLDSFRHMAAPNPFINEAAKIIRSNREEWKSLALTQLKKAADTPWGNYNRQYPCASLRKASL